jgi:hypothetical protein
MILAKIGTPAELQIQLYDGASTKGPRAYVRNSVNALVATVDLTHAGQGNYTGFFTPSAAGYYVASFTVFTDLTHTVEDMGYSRDSDIYCAYDKDLSTADLASAVWGAARASNNIAGSFGEANQGVLSVTRANNLDNLNATISSRATPGDLAPLATTAQLSPLATTTQVNAARDLILDAISNNIQTDVRVTVGTVTSSNTITFQIWLNIDGEPVTAVTSASIQVFNNAGGLIFALGPDTTPTAAGVFSITQTNATSYFSANNSYMMHATVIAPSGTYVSLKAFTVF